MKTLVKGRPQVGWARELICTGEGNGCGGCLALLLVEMDDVYRTHAPVTDEYFNTFLCQECGVETDISGKLPFHPPSKEEWLARRGRR